MRTRFILYLRGKLCSSSKCCVLFLLKLNWPKSKNFYKTRKDTKARVAGRRKERLRSNCAWIIFQRVSMRSTIRRYWIHRSLCQHPCYCFQLFEFSQNRSFLLPRFFCPPYTIAIASSACRTFASSLIDVFAVFVFSNWSMFLASSMSTYNFIELHRISKKYKISQRLLTCRIFVIP